MGRTIFSKAYTVLPFCRTQSFIDSGKWEEIAVLLSKRNSALHSAELMSSRLNGSYCWVCTHWTDKICLALQKLSTKFVSAKFSICQAWAHWITAKYLLTKSVNHMEINTSSSAAFNLITCSRETCTCTCTWLTRVDIRMYKLNRAWSWRCSWNVNVDLGTVIVVLCERIVVEHTEVRIFHVYRLIAAQT